MKALTLVVFAGFIGSASATAYADVLPDGNGGAVCKNTEKHPGSCTALAVECKGTYTEYVDPEGHTYGKCTKVLKQGLGFKQK